MTTTTLMMMMTVAATTEHKTFPRIHGGPTKYLVSFGLSWPHKKGIADCRA